MTEPIDPELRRRLRALRDPVVRTPRLELRLPDPKRLEELVPLISDRTVARWTLTIPFPYTMRDARDWLRRATRGRRTATHLGVHIVRRSDGVLIGGTGLHHFDPRNGHAELGYWIGRPYRRQGYAAEAAGALTSFAFRRLGFHRVEARISPGNAGSAGVLRSLGFRREGRLRSALVKDGRLRDEIVYGRLDSDGPVTGRRGRRRRSASRASLRPRSR
jgi:[ribosomal protein S5]-alanine N-acetyltransferase